MTVQICESCRTQQVLTENGILVGKQLDIHTTEKIDFCIECELFPVSMES